jgi:hypothetical protein
MPGKEGSDVCKAKDSVVSLFKVNGRSRRHTLGDLRMKRPHKIAIGVSAGVGGAVGSGVAVATDLSPVATAIVAGLLSALLGLAAAVVTLRLLGEY